MLFYVPEWNDSVDANYDFTNDEPSYFNTHDREHAFIWDLFPADSIPIDGVRLSRPHIESTPEIATRLLTNGVYNDTHLNLPDWMPTISDTGAFSYRNLPFPPYNTHEMLEFYETLGVTTGVTTDHILMGNTPDTTRLYLDATAFTDTFTPADLPETLHQHVDVMVSQWPDEWPDTVYTHEPSLRNTSPDAFTSADFTGSLDEIRTHLETDPRAVYRDHDTKFRYELSIKNAIKMRRTYETGNYSFRLMGAIHGWNTDTYQSATKHLLNAGYDYIGIGSIATAGSSTVSQITTAVNNTISHFQNTHSRRVNLHLFDFANTDILSTIATAGTSSFDSSNILRSAWTGDNNYHTPTAQYDALHVHYPTPTDSLPTAIKKSLASQTLLYSLTAYDTHEQPSEVLHNWLRNAYTTLNTLESYLAQHRHDPTYNTTRLQHIEQTLRNDFTNGTELQAAFSAPFRRQLVKLLRKDSPDNPLPFTAYTNLLETAKHTFTSFSPPLDTVREREHTTTLGDVHTIWPVIEWYTTLFNDTHKQENYRKLLEDRPWTDCSCPMCSTHGIDITVFCGNDRNCRRGFHNTHQFYQQFRKALPKIAVGTIPKTACTIDCTTTSIETTLQTHTPEFWETILDLPAAEIGVFDIHGLHEWWDNPTSPSQSHPRPTRSYTSLSNRYAQLFVYAPDGIPNRIATSLTNTDCTVRTYTTPNTLKNDVLQELQPIVKSDTHTIVQTQS